MNEDEIAAAMAHAYWREQQILEGGAAVGIAALLHDRVARLGRQVVVVLSGRNVDMPAFTDVVTARRPSA